MSTAINITVDDGGLPARNRQQVAANRQAFVQNVATEKSTALGVDKRSQERIAQGRDPATGALLIPPASTGALGASGGGIPRLNQQPAANRVNLAAPENPLVLDFSTAGNPITYPAGAGGGVFRLKRLTGKAKYKGNLLDSRYAAVTSDLLPAFTRLLLTNTNGGPFDQAYLLCTSSEQDFSSRIDLSYPSAYPAADIYSGLITNSPPFATLNFLPKLNSPQTIETDVLFPPSSSFLNTYCILTLKLTLVDNSILTDERAIAIALSWRPFFAGPTTNGFYMRVFRQASVPPYVENEYNRVDISVNSCVNGENLLGAGDLVYEPNSAYEPGWRRIALSVTNTGIRYFENSKLIYSFNDDLTRLFNRLPNTLAGFTWVPSVEFQAEVYGFSSPEPTGVSTIRYSNKRIGNTYIPSKLT
jgi:hypothetical protein